MKNYKFDIIIDTREKVGLWEFQSSKIGEIHRTKLDVGVYSIVGLEDILYIERKRNPAEFYSNITEKRFYKEFERGKDYKYKYMILEFDSSDIYFFPHNSDIPKKIWPKLKITPNYIFKQISEIQVNYGVSIIFAGNQDTASFMATNIMKRVYECERPS